MTRSLRRSQASRSRGFASPAHGAAAEVLESRVLPAITLLMDYSLDDSGFFNNPVARQAMESVAAELGSRLTDQIPALLRGTYPMVDPSTFTSTFVEFDAPANTLRVFAAGNDLSAQSGLLAAASSLTSSAIRRYGLTTDFTPYASFIGFGTNWNWDFDGRNGTADAVNFRAVARHEMMHALGIGVADSWHLQISSQTNSDRFNGPTATAVNGGVAPTTSTFDGNDHFEQGNFALMQPFLSDILRPTALDWAALDDLGWDVVLPGRFADVFARSSDGTWWASANANGLSDPYEFGKWADDAVAGWRDVGTSVDLNGDGFTDVVGRTAGGDWYAGINTSNGFENRFFGRWNEAANWQDVRFGDFTGDGKTDVVGRTAAGELWVGVSTGTGFQTTRWATAKNPNVPNSTGLPPAVIWQDVQVADFDGDGQDDVALRNGAGDWYVAISKVEANGFNVSYWTTWVDSGSGAFWRDVQAVDMDNDGSADLIGRTYTGEWYVGLSRPRALAIDAGTFSTFRWTTWNEAAGWRDVQAVDMNNDGLVDILGRTATGQFYVAQNIGGVQLSSIAYGRWTETRNGQNLWETVLTGDFAGGPRTDVLARATDGSWWLGRNDGQKLVFSAYGKWGQALGWRDEAATKKLVPAATPADGNPDAPPSTFFASTNVPVSVANLRGKSICGCAACLGSGSGATSAALTAGGSATQTVGANPIVSTTGGKARTVAPAAFAPPAPQSVTPSLFAVKASVPAEAHQTSAAPACPFEAARGALEATLADGALLSALAAV